MQLDTPIVGASILDTMDEYALDIFTTGGNIVTENISKQYNYPFGKYFLLVGSNRGVMFLSEMYGPPHAATLLNLFQNVA